MYNKKYFILFIVIVIVIVIVIFYLKKKITKFNDIKTKLNLNNLTNFRTLIVCVYNEDINWINDKKDNYDKIYIYIKNKNRYNDIKDTFNIDKIEVILIKNIGSCDFAYLYHIINNYNDLNGYITFHKGTVNEHIPTYKINVYDSNNNSVRGFSLPHWGFSNPVNRDVNIKYCKSEFKDLEDYLRSIFTKKSVDVLFKDSQYIIYTGYFTVNSSQIKMYDKKIFENLISFKDGPNREIDHFQERIWGLLFTNMNPEHIKLLSK